MATAKTVAVDNKKPLGGRIKGFFKGVWSELKKVHWPDKKQIAIYTGVVIGAVLVFAIALSLVDTVLSYLLNLVIK